MEEQQKLALEYLKTLDVNGCITGSALLGYYENSDIDIFAYNEAAFTKLLYTLKFNPMFTILDKLENWKAEDWVNSSYKGSIKKIGIVTIKFYWNLCMPVNIVYKERCNTAFDVLASFDLSIICKAIDLKTKQVLDLTNGTADSKIGTWNCWNPSYHNISPWSLSRICRQLGRVRKYQIRGFILTDMLLKYKSIIEDMMIYENIFDSTKVNEKLDSIKHNGKILVQIIDIWLEKGSISKEEEIMINDVVKLL